MRLSVSRGELDSLSPEADEWSFLKKNNEFAGDEGDRYRFAWRRAVRSEKELSNMLSEMEQQLLTPQLAVRYLLDKIAVWEKKYALVAPADGRLFFLQKEAINSEVMKGRPLFRIDADTTVYTAFARVPARELSRLQIGQQSRIQLDKHTAGVQGSLRARVDSIGVQEGGDTAYLRLRIEGGRRLAKVVKTGAGELTGKVDVILERKSMLARLFKNINMFF